MAAEHNIGRSFGRLDVLDGLRGIAVLLVLWYHVWEISWLPAPLQHWLEFIPETGFVGVHLFFFLSGFVISYPFVRAQWSNATPPPWAHFYWRRFLKIVPSYVLSIVVAYAIGYAATQSSGENIFADIASHVSFVHTWWGPTYGGINGVLWTLAVEVEFYALFPLVWWCFKRAPWVTFASMIVIALVWRNALASCCYTTQFAQWEENLPGYLDIFAFGMIAAYVYARLPRLATLARPPFDSLRSLRRPSTRDTLSSVSAQDDTANRTLATSLALIGFAALAYLLNNVYAFRMHDQWAGVWQIDRRPLLGLCFAAIALGSLWGAQWWRRVLANPILVFLGAISYNLYLYHQMVARELLWHHLPAYHGSDPHYDPQWQIAYTVVAFVVAIAQAALVTYVFERPILGTKPMWSKIRSAAARSSKPSSQPPS